LCFLKGECGAPSILNWNTILISGRTIKLYLWANKILGKKVIREIILPGLFLPKKNRFSVTFGWKSE